MKKHNSKKATREAVDPQWSVGLDLESSESSGTASHLKMEHGLLRGEVWQHVVG